MSRHHFVVVALAAAAMASSVRAHSTFLFDMGPASSPVQSAYTQITKSTLYASPSEPYGWASTTGLDDKTYASISPMIAHNGLREDVLRDSVVTTGTTRNCIFKADLPAGTYRCMVSLGDVGFGGTTHCDAGHTPLIHLSVAVDGDGGGFDSIATELEARTLNTKFPSAPEHVNGVNCLAAMTGGYLKLHFLVDVAPVIGSTGKLSIKFGCDGAEFSRVSVQGIELRRVEPMPIQFSHDLGSGDAGLMVDASVEDEAADDFVAMMNAGTADFEDLMDKISEFETSTAFERVTKASALLWLAGWLDGSQEGLLEGDPQDEALDDAIILLADDAGAGDNVAFELYDEALDFQMGVFHNRARGYLATTLPGSLDDHDALGVDPLPANLGAGELLLRQIDGDLFATSDDARFEAPPLSPRATMLRATQYFARSPTTAPATSPDPPNLANTWHAMITLMASRTELFVHCVELRMFIELADYSKLPNDWINAYLADMTPPNETIPTTYDPEDAWWAADVDVDVDSAAPSWANAQHRALRPLLAAGKWWVDQRLLGAGEFGGGGGDDVELVGSLLHVPRIFSPDDTYAMESPLELGFRTASDATLYDETYVDVEQGYFAGEFGDVEHAAEFTTDPLFGLWTAKYGDPGSVEVPIRTLGNMLPLPPPDDTHWTSVTASGPPESRRFRSYDFGADGVALAVPLDIPLNLRAIAPAFALSDFNENEDSIAILDALARAWRTDCMSTAEGKPAGIPPFSVHVADAHAGSFGTNGSAGADWWTSNGYSESPQYIEYVYTLLLNAYRHSTATDREDFLAPILAASEWMYDHRNVALSDTKGSDGWILGQLRTVVLQALFDARRELYAAGLMTSTSTLTQHLNGQLSEHAGPYARYVVSRHKAQLLGTHALNADWLTYFWPIATSTVAYTDRAFLSLNGDKESMFAELTGTIATSNPRPIVTWENPVPAQGQLDVAMLVASSDTAADVPLPANELRLLVYNFADSEQIVGFRIWHDLPFGNYTITYGPDLTGGVGSTPDDLPDAGTSTTLTDVSFEYRGQELSVGLGDTAGLAVPSHSLYAVRLQRTSDNGASLLTGMPDVAVGRLDVTGTVGGNCLHVRYHNLSTTATDVSVMVHAKSVATGIELGSEEGSALAGVTLGTPSSGCVSISTSTLPSTPIEVWLEFTRAQTTLLNDHVIVMLPTGS